MGSSFPTPCKQDCIDPSQLTLFRKSALGRHYRDKASNEEYLWIQIGMDPGSESDSSFLILTEHLKDRISKRKKHIPEILQFKEKPQQFCNFPTYSLWMRHSARSLEEEMMERREMKEPFAEGEVWMIIYSCVSAMIGYQGFGFSVTLAPETIFISANGDVVVSDASIYSSFKLLKSSKKTRPASENIRNLSLIVEQLMQNTVQPSHQLVQLAKLIGANEATTCRSLMSSILSLKSDLEDKKKQFGIARHNNIERVTSEAIQHTRETETACFDPLRGVNQKTIIVGLQQEKSSKENQGKQKFYRTTPILRCAREPLTDQFSLTTNLEGREKQWTEVELSSISQCTKSSRSDQNSNTLAAVNRLFESECPFDETQALWLKHKLSLQNLILNEKNVILEVPDSEVDLSSAQSKMSHSANVSIRAFTLAYSDTLGQA